MSEITITTTPNANSIATCLHEAAIFVAKHEVKRCNFEHELGTGHVSEVGNGVTFIKFDCKTWLLEDPQLVLDDIRRIFEASLVKVKLWNVQGKLITARVVLPVIDPNKQ